MSCSLETVVRRSQYSRFGRGQCIAVAIALVLTLVPRGSAIAAVGDYDPAPASIRMPSATTGLPKSPAPSDAAKPSDLDRRLARAGLVRGAPVLLRVFKEESELELWLQSGETYKRFATYPICRWRGVLGPKLVEGDRQSPEGFYSFGQDHLLWQGHWFRAININFPNLLDRTLGRTGSGILIHGACSSIGCYAMTDGVIDEMFDLVVAAFANGQARAQVHVFPFHMTLANLDRHAKSPWNNFWRDLKPASDLFVSTQVPPRIGMCDGRYVIKPGVRGAAQSDRVRDWCGAPNWIGSPDRLGPALEARRVAAKPPLTTASAKPPSERIKLYARLTSEGKIPKPKPLPAKPSSYGPSPDGSTSNPAAPLNDALAALPEPERAALLGVRKPGTASAGNGIGGSSSGDGAVASAFSCNASLTACRHFMATHAPVALRKGKTRLAKR